MVIFLSRSDGRVRLAMTPGTVQPKQLAMYLFAACACTAIGAVVIRIIMYGVGTSVEQFIYH